MFTIDDDFPFDSDEWESIAEGIRYAVESGEDDSEVLDDECSLRMAAQVLH